MGVLEFIATVLGHIISWPIILLIFIVAFRKQIGDLLGRISAYEALGQKVTFGDRLAAAEENVDKIVESVKAPQIEPPAEPTDEFDRLAMAADSNPSFAITSAWELLSNDLDELAESYLEPERRDRAKAEHGVQRELVNVLQQRFPYVEQSFEWTIEDLRSLRNRVAHGRHNPTSGEAVAYVETAKKLSTLMDGIKMFLVQPPDEPHT
jgi:hypothetical protein